MKQTNPGVRILIKTQCINFQQKKIKKEPLKLRKTKQKKHTSGGLKSTFYKNQKSDPKRPLKLKKNKNIYNEASNRKLQKTDPHKLEF